MCKFFRKRHEDITRAPLSFAFLCFGAGMHTVGILRDGFGLSDLAVINVASLVMIAGGVYFATNRKEEHPPSNSQGEKKGGPA